LIAPARFAFEDALDSPCIGAKEAAIAEQHGAFSKADLPDFSFSRGHA
jgi:hypothetical protein